MSRRSRAAGTASLLVLISGAAVAPGAGAAPAISARSAIVIEASSGMRLAARAPDAELPMASTTKLMTALIVLERARLTDVVTAPPYHPLAAESTIGLAAGARVSIRDLLIGMLLPSANDAAHALGARVGGSISRFVAAMNRRARELGLAHTHYASPVGLDEPGTFSSAGNLALLGVALRRFAFFRQTVASRWATVSTGRGRFRVLNRNDLLGRVPWVNGIKTGHTSGAGYVLVGSATVGGVTLISAVMGDPSQGARDADTLSLLRYGFGLVRLAKPVHSGAVEASRAVRGQSGRRVELVAGGDVSGVVRRGTAIERVVQAPAQLRGPLPAGRPVGLLIVRSGGRELGRVPLLLRTAVPAPGASLSSFGLPLAAGFLLLLGVGTLVRVRRRNEARTSGGARSRARVAKAGREPQ